MITELWYLIKLLFTKQTNQLEIVKMKYFPFKGYKAMSWCGKIITREDRLDIITINHERIHLEQALRYGSWIKYYLAYLWEYIKYGYADNKFEIEAYENQYKMPDLA